MPSRTLRSRLEPAQIRAERAQEFCESARPASLGIQEQVRPEPVELSPREWLRWEIIRRRSVHETVVLPRRKLALSLRFCRPGQSGSATPPNILYSDMNAATQSLLDRTPIRNFYQPLPLLIGKRALELDLLLDVTDAHFLGLAPFTILLV